MHPITEMEVDIKQHEYEVIWVKRAMEVDMKQSWYNADQPIP